MCMKKSKWSAARFRAVSLLLLIGAIRNISLAAPGDVDLSFDPGSGLNGGVTRMALQSDGKLIIGGSFTTVRGLARQSIARLNPDGSGDPTFDAGTNADQHVSAIALQSDGKVLFTREYSILSGEPAGDKVVRLNTNGTVDASFVSAALANAGPNAFTCVAVQPDGRILVGGYSSQLDGSGNPYPRSLLIRLNANGAIDNTFTNDTDGTFGAIIYSVALQVDGKILIAGYIGVSVNGTNYYGVARLNTNGTVDTNFQFGADGIVHSVGLQADGKILLAGYGIGNSPNWNGVARLNVDGSLDGTFQAGTDTNSSLISVLVQPDGKVICLGSVYVGGTNRNGLVRLNSNGSLDATFNPATGAPIAAIALQPDGKILIGGGLARLNSDGTLDANFNPGSSIESVNSLALQSDGKVIIGGATRNGVARLNANGTLDTSFDSGTGPSGAYVRLSISAVALQTDGKVLVGGDFSSFNGASRNRLVRLNPNGTVDTNFVPWVGAPLTNYSFEPTTFAVQPDGKILVGGNAALGYENDGSGLARLNANGSFDTSFHPDTLGTNGGDYAVISSLALQSDGKILAGGYVVRSDVPYYLLMRLNVNGSRDTNFAGPTGGSAGVTSIALQPDCKILVGVWYGDNQGRISRLNTNGSADNTFSAGSGADNVISSVLVQSNGRILVAGHFTSFNGTNCNHIVRLNANGSLDTNFRVSGVDGVVSAAALQPDGNILIAGNFITAGGALRPRIARLFGDSTLPLLSIARSSGYAVLSWPAAFGNFQLQENTNVSAANGWSAVAASRSTNNSLISVALPASGSPKFFRLRSP